jgi:hypothetical protein
MKNIIIMISLIMIIVMLLFVSNSFAKYRFSYEFNAMQLSYVSQK